MTKVSLATFSPQLVALMNSALDTAVHQIDRSNRTPATKAKMAQRIVRTASEGVTDLHTLMSAAVDEGRVTAEGDLGDPWKTHAADVRRAAAAALSQGT